MRRTLHRVSTAAARRGVAIIWALVVLACVAGLMGALTTQAVAARRLADRRQGQLQALWLARAGLELAVDRIRTGADGHTGEFADILPGAKLRLSVKRCHGPAETFAATSEARFRTEGNAVVVRTLSGMIRRTRAAGRVRVQMFPTDSAPVFP